MYGKLLLCLLSLLLISSAAFPSTAQASPHLTLTTNEPAAPGSVFIDVPPGYWAVQYIESLYQAGITGGCATNPLRYCPEDPVTRGQMAVFLERGIHGSAFSPSTSVPITFSDTATHWARYWIEALRADNITAGCGAGMYCPEAPVTRAQMAVFLLRSKYGPDYTPPPVGSGTGFSDVPLDYWSAAWIKQLAAEGITAGCGAGMYCPESPVTRAQMAVFLVRTFQLPLPPALGGVLVYALLYDPFMANEPEESFSLINLEDQAVNLAGWKATDGEGTVTFPAYLIAAGQQIWVTKNAASFRTEFGFPPNLEYGGNSDPAVPDLSGTAPVFANAGDEFQLLNSAGTVVDAVVYDAGNTSTSGWSGASISPYAQGSFTVEGQILYRKLDQNTGRPASDTNSAQDWAQAADDDINGKKIRYPGWDLERYFFPLKTTQQAHLTYLVAPDNIFAAYLAEINKATSSIYIEGYTFDNVHIANALIAKLQAGVNVRVLLEGGPVGGIANQDKWICQQLEFNGGECWFMFSDQVAHIHNRYDYQHSKFTVVDGLTLLTGSENLNYSSMPADDKSDGTSGNRGVYLITDAPALVARALDIYQQDLDPANHRDVRRWNAAVDSPPAGFVPTTVSGGIAYDVQFPTPLSLFTTFDFEVVQSPENSLRSADSLLGMVARAGAGDLVLVEQLYEHKYWGPGTSDPAADPNPRLEAYIDAARRGARVYILLDAFYNDSPGPRDNSATCAYVKAAADGESLQLNCLQGNPTGTGIHNKMILVLDGAQGWTHTGSINGSENSVKNNRELAIQVRSTDGFNYLAQVFNYDWVASGGTSIFGTNPQTPLISEVFYDTPGTDSVEEWFEIYNPTSSAIALANFKIGDEETAGGNEGMFAFPAGASINAGQKIVVALSSAGFNALYGLKPDFEITDTDPAVPNMVKYSAWASGAAALNNTGDEVLLLDPADIVIDAVVYGSGAYLGVTPHPGVASTHSIERNPLNQDTDNCALDFVDRASPVPR